MEFNGNLNKLSDILITRNVFVLLSSHNKNNIAWGIYASVCAHDCQNVIRLTLRRSVDFEDERTGFEKFSQRSV